jgi:SAM-dependent methyltransferase
MRISILVYRALRSLHNNGIGETCRRAGQYLIARGFFQRSPENSFDLEHHTDTGGVSPVWELDTDTANARFAERYQAVSTDRLQAALDFLRQDWSNFTFVDLGCGKGRALIAASEHGFARIIGVEFAKSLVDIARKNCELTGTRAEVKHEDAARFEFPNGNLLVFMYNPFRGQVMRQVIENLARHSGGKLYLLYYRPEEMAIIDERTDFLAKIGAIPTAQEFCAWQGADSKCSIVSRGSGQG